jgi:hypothetical protein
MAAAPISRGHDTRHAQDSSSRARRLTDGRVTVAVTARAVIPWAWGQPRELVPALSRPGAWCAAAVWRRPRDGNVDWPGALVEPMMRKGRSEDRPPGILVCRVLSWYRDPRSVPPAQPLAAPLDEPARPGEEARPLPPGWPFAVKVNITGKSLGPANYPQDWIAKTSMIRRTQPP